MSAMKFLAAAAMGSLFSVSAFAQTYVRNVEPVPSPDDLSDVVRAQHIRPGDVSPEEYARLLEEAERVKAFQGDYSTYSGYSDYSTTTSVGTVTSAGTVTSTGSVIYDGRPSTTIHSSTVQTATPSYSIELFDTPVTQSASTTTYGTAAVTSAVTTRIHTVAKGDTLYNISKRYNVSLSELRSSNSISGNNISIGQSLTVPGTARRISQNTYTNTSPTLVRNVEPIPFSGVYAVLPGDTLYSIARRACVSVSDISASNSLGGSTTIQPGQRLSLPSGHCLR